VVPRWRASPEYSADELNAAFAADEISRYVLMQHERGPEYSPLALTDAEPELDGLSPSDVDEAAWELASERGMDPAEVLAAVDALAGGERDTVTRACALVQLAALDDGAIELTVTAAKREQLADKGRGFALPDGSYPIADAKHLGTAKALNKQGKLAGHPASVVKAHINKAAARLGLPGLSDDDEDEDETDREAQRQRRPKRKPPQRGQRQASQGSSEGVAPFPGAGEGGEGPSGAGPGGELAATVAKRMMVRTADGIKTIALTDGQAAEVLGMTSETLSPVDRIIRRHPELFLANDDARNYNPAASAFEQAPEVLLKPPRSRCTR
jgi:hypothetical protein